MTNSEGESTETDGNGDITEAEELSSDSVSDGEENETSENSDANED